MKDELDWVPMSERHFKLFGACDEAIVFLRQHDMFNKPAGEIRQFILEQGNPEWYQQWIDTRHTTETYEKIARRIMKEYIDDKNYCSVNELTNNKYYTNNLNDAKTMNDKEKEEFVKHAESIGMFSRNGKPFDIINNCEVDDIEIAKKNYLDYNARFFYVEEEVTTMFGDKATKRVDL